MMTMAKVPRFKEFKYFDQLCDYVIDCLKIKLINGDELFNIGLAGGKTPLPLYQRMVNELPMDRLRAFLIDERYVSREDFKSNFFQVSRFFTQLKCFDTTLEIGEALEKYKLELPEKFDLAIVGVGNDGHFASIFPGYVERTEKVFYTETNEFDVKERLTISADYLLKAEKILIVISGQEKRTIFDCLKNKEKTAAQFPAIKLLEHHDIEILFADF